MERSGGRGEEGEAPRTGHAVLGEGLVNCLALSRRGVFTAGKVHYNDVWIQSKTVSHLEHCSAAIRLLKY